MEARTGCYCSRSGGVVGLLLLWQSLAVVRGLTPISSSSSSSSSPCAATTSPLFRRHLPASNSNNNHHHKVNVPALQALGYPAGLCQALVTGAQIYAKRYWIIDDSLSMMTTDGHFLLHHDEDPDSHGSNHNEHQQGKLEMVPCSRWNELRETCLQHAILAQHLDMHTDFRLLNCPTGHFRIPRATSRGGSGGGFLGSSSSSSVSKRSGSGDVQHAQKILSRAKPAGATPLTARLHRVRKEIEQSVLPKLKASALSMGAQKVAIVLATDGLPTAEQDHGHSTAAAKEEFRQALQALPPEVSVVIRLCTDDVAVVDYYKNELKQQAAAATSDCRHYHHHHHHDVQVLDDYWAEAERVHQFNPWLNYGLVLHRAREMGSCGHVPLLKELSQRSLTTAQVAEFCHFLFDLSSSSSASLAWDDLCHAVEQANENEGLVWNPIRSQFEPWVDLQKYEFASS